MMEQCKEKLNIAMFGQKRIPSREGGVEIVVEELCTRMVAQGHNVTCYKAMIRILHSVSNMDRAGIETMLMNYYRYMDKSKVQFI